MYSKFVKFCSVILTVALLINLLPVQVLGAEVQELMTQPENVSSEVVHDVLETTNDATILEEITDKRTEFSKEYKLSNGLNMVAVYPRAVHFENNGKWEEIDNTLKIVGSGANAAYTNTAGSWDVFFPQTLTGTKTVSVSADGYTLSFGMAGELRFSNTPVIRTGEVSSAATMATDEIYAVTAAHISTAQVYYADKALPLENVKYAETVSEKTDARLSYQNVYDNTNVVYDLRSNELKESIIINSFSSSLRGYQYVLNTGDLIPVLNDDNSIDLYNADRSDIVFAMPAPFMVDNSGEYCSDVGVVLKGADGIYTLSYYLPTAWLAEDTRSWPVVLDPVITKKTSQGNIDDQTVQQYRVPDPSTGVVQCGWHKTWGAMYFYMKFRELPEITSADVVVHAQVGLYKAVTSDNMIPVTVHKVLEDWSESTLTWGNQPDAEATAADYYPSEYEGMHYWDITDIARSWYETGANYGMKFEAVESYMNYTTSSFRQYYSPDYSAHSSDYRFYPVLYVSYRNGNGLESYWDYTSSTAGRAGTGYVNNASGNLVWIHNDIGFDGNRMPVSISHVYNTHDSATNPFFVGNGWRTNYHQTVEFLPSDSDGNAERYVWEDGDGTKHYFNKDSDGNYKDEDGLQLELTEVNGTVTIEDKNGNTSNFALYRTDNQHKYYRLSTLKNNQKIQSSITITYVNGSYLQIATITDGANRKYNFIYTGDLLSRIRYVGTHHEDNAQELAYVAFGYEGSCLTSITYRDTESSLFSYDSNGLLTTVRDVNEYELRYTYSAGSAKRVIGIAEYDTTDTDNIIAGGSISIAYAYNQTTLQNHNGNVQILQFNDWGNLVSVQDEQGRAQYAQYARNKYDDEASKPNQMDLSSKMQNTVSNRFSDNSFENGICWWCTTDTIDVAITTEEAYFGEHSLKVIGIDPGLHHGAYNDWVLVPAGKTITVSAYIKTVNASAAIGIQLRDTFEAIEGEIIEAGQDWSRYQVSYTNPLDEGIHIRSVLFMKSQGVAYMDCVQAELAPTASRYNLLDNGTFYYGNYAWSRSDGMTSSDIYAQTTPPIPELDDWTYRITGAPEADKSMSQTLTIGGLKDDCYVLSGWAQGDSVPLHTEGRTFGLSLTFLKNNVPVNTQSVSFNAACNSTSNWQYAATAAVAAGDYDSIKVTIHYGYNVNTVYFDGIQLFKESFGTSYTYDSDGNVESVVDLQNETTEYAYDTNNNLTSITQGNKAKMRYVYDNYHNVVEAITLTEDANGNAVDGIVYKFAYDDYGNNTQVSIVNGDQSISTSATYTHEGNHLETTQDALENKTIYSYNIDTSVLEGVQYPNDTEASQTTYDYEDMFRLKSAAAEVSGLSEGTALTAGYTYEGDYLTAIQTASTLYNFTYGAFGMRTAVSIGDRDLALYEYTDDANRNLAAIEYGNRQINIYNYDAYNRLVEELFDDGSTVSYEYDNTGALSTVTDSATGRKTTYFYDLIDRLGKYREVGPNFEHSVTYTYDQRNNLSKLVETINGAEYTTNYTYDPENRLVETNYGILYEEVRYDPFGRIDTTAVLDNGEPILSSIISYVDNRTPYVTGPQVAYIDIFSIPGYSADYAYEYDDNGNISYYESQGSAPGDDPYYDTLTRIRRSYYHYDTANQLVREDNEWLGKTFVWAYDNAGNITIRKEYAYTDRNSEVSGTPTATYNYTYGDSSWGDLLTAYNGVARTYDDAGNVLTDGTWTYTWRNGRELASMTDSTVTWSYVYDANGMRTSRSNGATTYNYVYNGSQLVQMTVGNDTLHFTYGLLGPTTVTWNGDTYYYTLNGQGDVTGIFDRAGQQVVIYNWDNAWGYNPQPEGSMASTLGALNPLRYRSYVYDSETGYYYLQSRYYDPEIGRFINADALVATGQGLLGNNMFAYCGNNPVSRKDDGGEFWHLVVGGVIGGVIGAISSAASGGDVVDVLIGAVAGAAGGVLAASGAGVVVQALGSAAISMASNAASQVNHIVQDETGETEFDVGDMLFDGTVGLACGAWGGNGASYGNSGGIMAAGKQLFKRGFFNPQARSYYAKVAHNMGGEYVFKPLLQSLGKSAVGSTIVTGKNILIN